MARISTYPKDTDISLTDRLLGTDAENSLSTKQFEITDVVSFLRTQNLGTQGPRGPQGVQGNPGTAGAVGPAGLNWQGAWVSMGSYFPDDAVGFGGASYFCLNEIADSTESPYDDTTNWALLASQGAQGIQGVQGIPGAPSSDIVKTKKITITQAQILNMFSSPVSILQSLEAGVIRIPTSIICKRASSVGTAYVVAANQFKLSNNYGASFTMSFYNTPLSSVNGSSFTLLNIYGLDASTNALESSEYFLGAYVSNPTDGTGDINIYITYNEITL